MSDRTVEPEEDEGSEWRMRRARAAIDRSSEELLTRTEEQAGGRTSPGAAADPPEAAVEAVASQVLRPGAGLDEALERRVAEAAESIHRRVAQMVSARLGNAERRLELQTRALEAALGEEAVQARLAAEQVEQVRSSLSAASEAALREVDAAFSEMRERAARDLTERTTASVAEVEARVRGSQAALETVIDAAERKLTSAAERAGDEVASRLKLDATRQLEASERRLGDRAAAGLTEARRSLGDLARTTASQQAETSLANAHDRLEKTLGERVTTIKGEVEGLMTERADRLGNELEARVAAATERGGRQGAAGVRARLEGDVARLQAELEVVGAELSKRSIRRERKRLVKTAAEQLTRVDEALEARRAEIAAGVGREAAGHSERIAAELDAGLGVAREELERANAAAREELEKAVTLRGEEAVAAALERRVEELERRLQEVNERTAEIAERRVEAASEAAEARIAAADRAQEREESIRQRTEAARAEAEGRVRVAEQRLVEVLAELEPADRGSIGPTPLER